MITKDFIVGSLAVVLIIIVCSGFCYSIYRIDKKQNELINKCEYGVYNFGAEKCNTKEKYCRIECRYMLKDLNDTWGSNTNNADTISKTIIGCYNDCIKND